MKQITDDVIKEALQYAEQLRESDNDPEQLAHVALYLKNRVDMLQTVFKAAESYLNFGQTTHHHTELVKAVDRVRHAVEKDDATPRMGL
jgi:hypothetical protein